MRKMRLNERIDAIGKKPKAQRRKKKGDDDVDVSYTICKRTSELTADCRYISRRDLRETAR